MSNFFYMLFTESVTKKRSDNEIYSLYKEKEIYHFKNDFFTCFSKLLSIAPR